MSLDKMHVKDTFPALVGMQLAITRWPKILLPAEVEGDAREFYAQADVGGKLPGYLPLEEWVEYYVRGYALIAGQLVDRWGAFNSKLEQDKPE